MLEAFFHQVLAAGRPKVRRRRDWDGTSIRLEDEVEEERAGDDGASCALVMGATGGLEDDVWVSGEDAVANGRGR